MTTQMQNGQVDDFQMQLQALEGDIARLCQENCPLDQFYRDFLDRIIRLLGDGGAIWESDKAGGFALRSHMNLNKAGLQPDGPQNSINIFALNKVVGSQQGIILPPNNASNIHDGGLADQVENNSNHTLLYLPIIVESKVEAVFLLISPEGVDARAITGLSGYLVNLCNQAAVFILRFCLLDQNSQIQRADRLREFVSSLHSSLDTRRACYALANFSQELLGVYRCMAGVYNSRGKFRMDSVSGLESVAVKSSFIKSIAEISKEVCKTGKVLLIDNPSAAVNVDLDGGDDLVTAARLYMLQAGSSVMGIFPIICEEHVVGALVVEKVIEEPFGKNQRQQIDGLLVEAGRAFTNCLSYRDMPLSLAGRALGSLRDKLYRMPQVKRAIWIMLLMVLLVLPFIVPKKVKVMGNAEVVPTASEFVYAREMGIVEEVPLLGKEGRLVMKGEVLASLDKQDIESDIARVGGLIAEVKVKQGAAIGEANPTLIKQYGYSLAALEAELKKYKLAEARCDIVSPISGRIITRESEIRQLKLMPVTQGQLLLEVVPENPKWEFIVKVPEDEAGPLLAAHKETLENGETLTARIKLKSYPKLTLESKVLGISHRAYVETTGEQKYRNVISVRVALPENIDDFPIDLRKGLEGNVAIECGQRSLFYVVTREFSDFLRISLF
ncbi:MAG: efflux RND transporter periplasmic adaptor subunit [Phycisphaerae bacterium]|nr:efflux RND transporter periplasmic adaptor subunit [Phycisphaerae bacterium]